MAFAGEPRLNRWLLTLIAVCGLAVLALAIAAEGTRAKTYTYMMDFEQEFHCHYPSSAASAMAFAAAGLLVLAMALVHFLVGCIMALRAPRYYVGRFNLYSNIAIVVAWVFFTVSFVLLVVGGVENQYHTRETTGGFTELKCSIVKQGTFATAGVFGFLCVVMVEIYYVLGIKIRWEIWRTAGSYSSTALESEIGQWPKNGQRNPLPPVPEEAL